MDLGWKDNIPDEVSFIHGVAWLRFRNTDKSFFIRGADDNQKKSFELVIAFDLLFRGFQSMSHCERIPRQTLNSLVTVYYISALSTAWIFHNENWVSLGRSMFDISSWNFYHSWHNLCKTHQVSGTHLLGLRSNHPPLQTSRKPIQKIKILVLFEALIIRLSNWKCFLFCSFQGITQEINVKYLLLSWNDLSLAKNHPIETDKTIFYQCSREKV